MRALDILNKLEQLSNDVEQHVVHKHDHVLDVLCSVYTVPYFM